MDPLFLPRYFPDFGPAYLLESKDGVQTCFLALAPLGLDRTKLNPSAGLKYKLVCSFHLNSIICA